MISMPAGKMVRISEDTMKRLAKVRNGFESPDKCINRLLSKNPCSNETKEQIKEKDQESQESDEESGLESKLEA